jgi:nucleotide-binding universal stress UspA family protein
MPRTIIIGVDGSDRDDDALALGGLLAETLSARVLTVSICSYPALSDSEDELARAILDQAQSIAARAGGRLRGVAAEARALASWSPAHGLERVARDEHAEIVVVGSSRRGALGRVMAGSTPERLMHDAPCAVAIAPLGYADADEHALAAIGVGFDGGPESRAALDAAAELARAARGKLTVIGVVGIFAGPLVQSPATALEYVADVDLLREREQRIAREAIAGLAGIDVEIQTPAGDAGITLVDLSSQLDLLLVGSHAYGPLRRLLHGSVSTRLARSADCPVLVLAPGGQAESEAPPATAAAIEGE